MDRIGAAPSSVAERLDEAAEGLAQRRPDLSAKRTLTWGQIAALAGLILACAAAFRWAPGIALAALHAALLVVFSLAIVLRAAAAIASLFPARPAPPWPGPPPRYALIVPLHREAASAPGLIAALSRLDYPQDQLDILLTLEADDDATLAAIAAALPAGPTPFRVILTPKGGAAHQA